ncbi:MAG TPA: tyrosine-type recombinase/integrase, partial [Jiangellales bacterium]|nr:tyrosine-type recombinase/integrase [Jiangellales bacterium]
MTSTDRRRATGSGGNRKGRRESFGSVRVLSSSRVQARYTGPDGRTHNAPTTFDTKGDARAWLAVKRSEIVRDAWKPEAGRPVLFGAYADAWITGRDVKPRTRQHYRALLDSRIRPTFGDMPVRAITAARVRAWHSGLDANTPTIRAHAYALLRTILGTAVVDGLLPANPCHLRGAGTTHRAHKVEPATLDELAALVEAMPPRYRLMTLLAAWCGLRFGELAELRRGDVDLRNGVLHVRRGVVRVRGEVIVGTPKTAAGVRDVAIPPHLLPAVREHLHTHIGGGRDGLLFPAKHGGHLAPATLYRVFYPAREAAGRPDLRWHDLRHTGAVLAASTGATLAELMARLGHSTPAAALRYQHAAQGRD